MNLEDIFLIFLEVNLYLEIKDFEIYKKLVGEVL